jgi:periplasmic copper chaperone A
MKRYFFDGYRDGAAFRVLSRLALAALAGAVWMAVLPPSRAHDLRHGEIHIGHVWAKPALAGRTTEVYFAIVNRGAEADRLVGARTPLAGRVVLAETQGEAAAPRPSIELAPSRPVALRPGRLHVRLDGLTRDLRPGDQFVLTLVFAQGPPADVTAIVETAPGH